MRYWIVALCCWAAAGGAAAGNLRIATVDMKLLFKQYPGTFKAQKKFEDLVRDRKQMLSDSEDTLGELQKDLNGRLSVGKKRLVKEKLSEATRDYQDEKSRIEDELDARQREMTADLVGKIREIVAEVAEEKGVDLVLDSDIVDNSNAGQDLTSAVLEKFAKLKPDSPDSDGDDP